jgi:hypothetical protein
LRRFLIIPGTGRTDSLQGKEKLESVTMGSLYHKALALLRRQPPPPSAPAESTPEADSGLTATEREEIRTQINQILAENRLEITAETLAFKPQRNASLLPLLINLFAVALAAAGIYGLWMFFKQGEEKIVSSSEKILLAEGKLLEAMKKEAEERLSLKDQEISSIQRQLEQAGREREKAQAGTAARVREQEQALRQEMQALLDEQTRKMQREGLSAGRIEGELRALAAQQSGEMERKLAEIRREAEAALQAREAGLTSQIRGYEQTLQQSRLEQERLQRELEQRQTQLASPPSPPAADTGERARLEGELSELREQSRREQLAGDQILLRYRDIRADLEAARYPQALQGLEGLQAYLDQPSVSSIPALQKRISQERFVVASLAKWIGSLAAPPPPDPLAPLAALLAEAGPRFQRGELVEAQAIYRQALEEIPAIRAAYARLTEIENILDGRRQGERAGLIAEGDRLLKAGDTRRALDCYARAAEPVGENGRWGRVLAGVRDSGLRAGRAEESGRLEPRLDELSRRLAAANRELEETNRRLETANRQAETLRAEGSILRRQIETLAARRESLRGRVRQAQADLQAFSATAGQAASISEDRLLTLLRYKLQIKEILDSPPVLDRHPDLYEGLEQLLAATEAEQRRAGRAEGLRDANRILETLAASGDLRALRPVWSGYGGGESGTELKQILEATQKLLD